MHRQSSSLILMPNWRLYWRYFLYWHLCWNLSNNKSRRRVMIETSYVTVVGQNPTRWAPNRDEGWKLRQDLQRHARGDVASPSHMEIDAQKSACLQRIGVTLEVVPSYMASGYRRWMGLCAPSSSLDVFMKQVFIKGFYTVNTSRLRVSVSERTVTLYFHFKTKVTLETCLVSVDLEQIWNWN